MAPPTETVLAFLTHPNPKIEQWREIGGSNTSHQRWDPIEAIRPLKGFTFNNCYQTYKADLKKPIAPIDLHKLVPQANMHRVMNEDTVVPLAAVCNIFPVNMALSKANKNLYIAAGSMFPMRYEDGKPDWGIGDGKLYDNNSQGLVNYCPGDSKLSSKWTCDGLLDPNLNVKDPDPRLRNQLRPLEQIQHYSRSFQTPWGWILTDKVLHHTNKDSEKGLVSAMCSWYWVL